MAVRGGRYKPKTVSLYFTIFSQKRYKRQFDSTIQQYSFDPKSHQHTVFKAKQARPGQGHVPTKNKQLSN